MLDRGHIQENPRRGHGGNKLFLQRIRHVLVERAGQNYRSYANSRNGIRNGGLCVHREDIG